MLGLIKKDFLLIKANLKSMIIIFMVYFLLAWQGIFDITLIVPIICCLYQPLVMMILIIGMLML